MKNLHVTISDDAFEAIRVISETFTQKTIIENLCLFMGVMSRPEPDNIYGKVGLDIALGNIPGAIKHIAKMSAEEGACQTKSTKS